MEVKEEVSAEVYNRSFRWNHQHFALTTSLLISPPGSGYSADKVPPHERLHSLLPLTFSLMKSQHLPQSPTTGSSLFSTPSASSTVSISSILLQLLQRQHLLDLQHLLYLHESTGSSRIFHGSSASLHC